LDQTWAALPQPAGPAVAALRARGVTHVVFHRDRYSEEFLDEVTHLDTLHLVAEEENIRIYRLMP
jgi:hypothetical protein